MWAAAHKGARLQSSQLPTCNNNYNKILFGGILKIHNLYDHHSQYPRHNPKSFNTQQKRKQLILKKKDQWTLPNNHFKMTTTVLKDIKISSMNEKTEIETIKKEPNENSKTENIIHENVTTLSPLWNSLMAWQWGSISCKVMSTTEKTLGNLLKERWKYIYSE